MSGLRFFGHYYYEGICIMMVIWFGGESNAVG